MKSMIAALAMALFAAPALAEPLKVAADCTYPPFGYQDSDGVIKGFDVDIANEIGKRLNRETEIVCQAWDGMIPGLLAGKYDLISASMSITEERMKSINFSIPYRSSSARFVGPKDSGLEPVTPDGQPNPAGIEGKTVAIQRASTYLPYFTDKFPGAKIAEYDKADNMILDLQSGRVDLIFHGPIKMDSDFLSKPEGKDYGFVGPEINDTKYFGPGVGIGIRKEDTELQTQVNAALEGMFKDGTFKTINLKYWTFPVLPGAWAE
ncbi:MAG: transporter substrate-binding domain-containing protein [Paracoccus sp. (in: a-proteobacteria)]|uniref:transporter substrate-binding domain-containing protein n=1 Tax=Paracoccus sp. TaxID=267 RepID=UPI0039E6D589